MTPRATVVLTIEKPAAGGRMIARHDGAIVLVSGAIPGETVEARVERVQRGTVWAATTRVMQPSPDRVEAGADGACGGAVFSHIAYERQLALKGEIVADGFARIGKMALPGTCEVARSPRHGYRMRARLHVRRGRIGFFREGTHEWCDPGPTGQLTPDTMATLGDLESALAAWPIGAASEVVVAEDVPGTARLLHLELAAGIDAPTLPPFGAIEGAAGLSAATPDGHRVTHLAGAATIADDLTVGAIDTSRSFRLTRHAQSFFQGNRFLLQPLVDAVMNATPTGPVLDLYAGVGLFSVAAACRGETVVAVEGDRWAAEDLSANAARHAPGRWRPSSSIRRAPASAPRRWPESSD
jgi:23S rRNA (uracil1939-C5)-methyltransferase